LIPSSEKKPKFEKERQKQAYWTHTEENRRARPWGENFLKRRKSEREKDSLSSTTGEGKDKKIEGGGQRQGEEEPPRCEKVALEGFVGGVTHNYGWGGG